MLRRLRLVMCVTMILLVAASAVDIGAQPHSAVYLPLVSNDPRADASSLPDRAPTPLIVLSSTGYVRNGGVYVVGEVHNRARSPLYHIKVEARFYDRGGDVVASGGASTLLTLVARNRRVPFRIWLADAPLGATTYDVRVVDWRTSSPLDYRALRVVQAATRHAFGIEVLGDVRNPHPTTIHGAKVAVTFYNADGRVVEAQDGYAREPEMPAGSVAAYVVPAVQDVMYATYTVEAQGYRLP